MRPPRRGPRAVAAVVALSATLAASTAFVATPTASGTEQTARYPYWTEGAHTEAENDARKDHVRERIRDARDRVRGHDRKIAELRDRIDRVKARRAKAREVVRKNEVLLRFLKIVTGAVEWLYSTRICESTNNYQAHSASGTYHGAYQFDYPSWGRYGGYSDPHAPPWYVQDAGAAEEMRARGTSPWPNCG